MFGTEAWEALRRAAAWEGRCDGVPSLLVHNKDEGHWGLVQPMAGTQGAMFLKLDTKLAVARLYGLSEPPVPRDLLRAIMASVRRELPAVLDEDPREARAFVERVESLLSEGGSDPTGHGAAACRRGQMGTVEATVHEIEGLTDAELVAGVLARDAHGVAEFERLYGGAWGETSACDTLCAESLFVESDQPMPLEGGKLTPLFVRGAAYAIAEAGIAHAYEIAVARAVHVPVERIRKASRDSGKIARWIQQQLASDRLPEALQRIVRAQMREDPEWTGMACSLLRQSLIAWRIDLAVRAGRDPTATKFGDDRHVARMFALLYLGGFAHLIRQLSATGAV